MENIIGKHVIVRAEKAGVFFGILKNKNGSEVELEDFRKIFYWEGAAAVEQIALEGVKAPDNCKITVENKQCLINNYIQIIPCSETAINNIKAIPVWKR